MTTPADTARPQRSEVAAAYDLGVDAYVALWSPVILPAAQAVVAALDLDRGARVLDVGAGSGALTPSIHAAAADVTVVGLDASTGMLRNCRSTTRIPAICGDALALPIRDAAVDAVVLAFVLFHLADPIQAIAEAARVLTGGGRIGTATWAQDDLTEADAVWDKTLTEAGAPPLPARRVDVGLDGPDAIHRLLTDAGLSPTRIWLHPLSQLWKPATYYRFATGSGRNKQRLQQLDIATRSKTLRRVRKRLHELDPGAFAWHGEVVCAVATLPGVAVQIRGGSVIFDPLTPVTSRASPGVA
jgi:SAM-dependent methyltransferase